MLKNSLLNPIKSLFAVYVICWAFRILEYFFIRTDQSILGEAFLHKLAGILILALAVRRFALRWPEIGFRKRAAAKNLLLGLMIGVAAFLPAYGAEMYLQAAGGHNPALQLYVSSYSVSGNLGHQTGLLFFSICALGNIINVVMEEGIFRGLFLNLAERRMSFLRAVLLSSFLFGVWHIAAPVRSLLDGEISPAGAMMSSIMLIVTAGLTGAVFCLLTKMTGSLWTAMAAHFVNNFVVNILHITTAAGADELQVIRITIAQTLSFLIVLVLYLKSGAHRRETFHR